MEFLLIWLKLIAATVIGLAFQLVMKNMSQMDTAKKANLEYQGILYFIKRDRKAILGTLLTMSAFFLLFGDVIHSVVKTSSSELKPYMWGFLMLSGQTIASIIVMVICMTIAYMGQDVALRFLGRTSRELKEAIDHKTNIADSTTNNLDKPTPVK